MKKHLITTTLTTLIILVLTLNLTIATTPTPQNTEYYTNFANPISEFEQLPNTDKSKVWEDSINTKEEGIPIEGDRRNDIVAKLAEEISKTRAKSAEGHNLATILAKRLGIKAEELSSTHITDVKGFSNPDLQWSTEKGAENVIGNGNVWLNLDDLPLGVNGLEYKDGKFILTSESGEELIIEPGATNNKGEALGLAYGKEETTGPDGKPTTQSKSIPLSNFAFTSKGKGTTKLTEKGFKLEGEAKLSFDDMSFERPKNFQGESSVKLNENGFVIKGVDFTKDEFLKRTASNDETIVGIGNFENILSGNTDGITSENPLESVVSEASFMDYSKENPYHGNVDLKFNNQGKLTHIKKGDRWIPFTVNPKGDSDLGDIYKKSSSFVQDLINRAHNGEEFTYSEIRKRFYQDPIIKQAGEIKTKYNENFIAINGDNLYVSGESKNGQGEISLLTDLNSLTSVGSKGQIIQSGDLRLTLNGKDLGIPTTQKPANHGIRDIFLIGSDGKARDKSWKVAADSKGTYIASESDTLVAGRITGFTSNTYGDLSIEIPRKDYEGKVKPAVSGPIDSFTPGDNLVKALMEESKFSLRLDASIPKLKLAEQVGLDSKAILQAKVTEMLEGSLLRQPLKEFDDRTLTETTITAITEIVNQAIEKIPSIDAGRLSIAFQNNPKNKNQPLLIVSSGGTTQKPIKITDKFQGEFIRDVLEGSLRYPNEFMGTTLIELPFKKPKETRYWPSSTLRRIWYYNLGLDTRIMGLGDEKFIYGKDGLSKKYTQ